MLARWLLGRRAFPLALTLWLLAAGPVGPLGLRHAATPDDAGCGPGAAQGLGQAGAALETPKDGAVRDHCAVCHWLQSFRLGLSPGVQHHEPGELTSPLAVGTDAPPRGGASSSVPARAPPADPL